MFCYNFFNVGSDVLLAVCDENLLGKEIHFDDSVFEVKKDFYGENRCTVDKIKEFLEKATVINAVGNKIVELLIKEGYVENGKTIEIGGVLHAQVVTIE